METLPRPFRQFQDDYPAVWEMVARLGEAAATAGPLEPKARELIKLGMAAALRGESAVHSHTHRALDAGATPAEIEHAVLLGVTTLGFPGMMTALTWVKAAIGSHRRPGGNP